MWTNRKYEWECNAVTVCVGEKFCIVTWIFLLTFKCDLYIQMKARHEKIVHLQTHDKQREFWWFKCVEVIKSVSIYTRCSLGCNYTRQWGKVKHGPVQCFSVKWLFPGIQQRRVSGWLITVPVWVRDGSRCWECSFWKCRYCDKSSPLLSTSFLLMISQLQLSKHQVVQRHDTRDQWKPMGRPMGSERFHWTRLMYLKKINQRPHVASQISLWSFFFFFG